MKLNFCGWISIKNPIGRQMLAGACANLMTAVNGTSSAWMTANYLTLQNEESSLPSGPLTMSEASLVLSIFYAGGMIGNFVAPMIVRRFGSKRAIFGTAFPQMVVFSLFAWAPNVYYLYTASVLSGFVAACHIVAMPVFSTEIVDDKFRGTINSFFDIFYYSGFVIGFLLAFFFDYSVQAKVLLIFPVLFLIAFVGIPQTPQHLINKSNRQAAIDANIFFKGTELEFPSEGAQEKSKLTLSDFTNHRALKAIFITFTMMILITFQGSLILTNYVTEIFSTTNPNISPLYASTAITVVLLLATLVFLFIVDRFNRRTLYITSATTTGSILTLFAVYLLCLANDHRFDWAPVVFVSIVLFVNYLGMFNVTWLIMIEAMPAKIKHFGISACSFLFMVDNLIFTAIYPYVKEYIGLLGWIVIFAVSCFFSAIFGFIFVPETKGKSHAEIMKILDK